MRVKLTLSKNRLLEVDSLVEWERIELIGIVIKMVWKQFVAIEVHRKICTLLVQDIYAMLQLLGKRPGSLFVSRVQSCNSEQLIDLRKFTVFLVGTVRDGFMHRPNRPWPRAPRFWGPRVIIFPMTTQCQLKICKTAQRHSFTIYLETGGTAYV